MRREVFVYLQACHAPSVRSVSLWNGETLPPFPKVFLGVETVVA